jgi:hypothetical protein
MRALFAIVLALAFVILGGIARTDLWVQILVGVSVLLITWFGTLWLGLGLPNKILQHYGRFVLPRGSLVVLQETEERTTDVIALLRSIGT